MLETNDRTFMNVNADLSIRNYEIFFFNPDVLKADRARMTLRSCIKERA